MTNSARHLGLVLARLRRPAEGLAVVLFYGMAAVFLFHPLFSSPGDSVLDPIAQRPMGALVAPDINLTMWVISWDWHALTTAPWTLFNANVFHPAPNALASSEHMLGHLPVFGPVYALSHNPVLANQINLLLCFALSGTSLYALLRHWGAPAVAALFGGFVYAFSPVRVDIVGHTHLLSGQYLPLALLFLDRTLVRPRASTAAAFGGFLLLQMLCSYYLAYITATALAGYVAGILWAKRGRLEARAVALLLVAGAVAGIVFVGLSLPYLRLKNLGVIPDNEQSWILQVTTSGLLTNYVYPPALIRSFGYRLARGNVLYVGALAAVGAIAAMLPWRRTAPAIPWARAAACGAALACYVMALGPNLHIGSWTATMPYGFAIRFVPGFSAMRVVSRFGLFFMLGFGALAGLGWARIVPVVSRGRAWVGVGLLAALLAGTVFEYDLFAQRYPLRKVPLGDHAPAVYGALAALPPGPVLEIPAGALALELAEQPAESGYMFYSTFHWHPILNGYSGYRPPSYDPVMTLARALPDARAMATLVRTTGLRYVVVHMSVLWPDQRQVWAAPVGLRRLGTYGPDVLYEAIDPPAADLLPELIRRGPRPTTVLGTPLATLAPTGRHATISLRRSVPGTMWGIAFPLELTVTNTSTLTWPSLSPTTEHVVMLAFRWTDASGRVVSDYPNAARLPYDLAPGESSPAMMTVVIPQAFGPYRLEVGVAQDGVWFSEPLVSPVTTQAMPSHPLL